MDSMAKQKMLAAKLDNTTWISALQLALWDNIFGPRVDQVRSPQTLCFRIVICLFAVLLRRL